MTTQVKRWLPLAGLAVLTISLIFFFKQKDSGDFLKEQSSNLLSFYTQNLKPLLAGSSITREDVFNFAFYQELPLDKDNNQYLQLGSLSGQEYFEFRKSPDAERTGNLTEFTNKLNLNEKEREQIDSILEGYSEQLKDKILVNENNTIAINTNLWNLRKAVLADVMSFAAKSNKEFAEVYHGFNLKSSPSVNELIKNVRSARDSNYIFITPDTIFTRAYQIDRAQLEKDLVEARRDIEKERDRALKVRINFEKDVAKLHKQRNKSGYKFHTDSNFVRVEVPDIPEIIMPEINDILVSVQELTKNMQKIRVNIVPPVPPQGRGKSKTNYNYNVPTPPGNEFQLDIDIPNIDSLVMHSLSGTKLMDAEYWEDFGRRMDSLGRKYEHAGEEFDKEKFREEMQRLQKDLQKQKNKTGTSVKEK